MDPSHRLLSHLSNPLLYLIPTHIENSLKRVLLHYCIHLGTCVDRHRNCWKQTSSEIQKPPPN